MDDGFLSPWGRRLRSANKRPYDESDRSWTPDDGSSSSKRTRTDQSPSVPPFPIDGPSEEQSCGGSHLSQQDTGERTGPLEHETDADLMDADSTNDCPWVSQVPQRTAVSVQNNISGKEFAQTFDTCFGVIELGEVTIGSGAPNKGKALKEVELKIESEFVMIRYSKSKNFAGFLQPRDAQTVLTLTHTFQATLELIIKGPTMLAATVYGFQANADSVGQFLSEKEYFLQTPDQNGSVPYLNPQAFIPPGTDSQEWHSSLETDMDINTMQGQATNIDPITKSKIQKVLDSASGPSTFSETLVSNRLKTPLKLHQRKALAMMVEKESGNIVSPEFPSVWLALANDQGKIRYKNTVTGSWKQEPPILSLGGILADDMGLGKSLTALALVAGSIPASSRPGDANKRPKLVTLILAPLSTLPNWNNEIKTHFHQDSVGCLTYHGPKRGEQAENFQDYEIVITNYETVTADNRKASKTEAIGPLHRMKWHRIILDEAHIIRNRKSGLFEAVSKLEARHKWCLTGTPIQNSIEDLGALVGFLQVTPFDDAATFTRTFVLPIRREDPKGWTELTSLIKAVSLRRTKETETRNLQLPPRDITIQSVHLNAREQAMYEMVARTRARGMRYAGPTDSLFTTILRLRQISNHGCDLLPIAIQDWVEQALKSADIAPEPPNISTIQTCEFCQTTIPGGRGKNKSPLPCLHLICGDCLRTGKPQSPTNDDRCPICSDEITLKAHAGTGPHSQLATTNYVPSSKVKAVLEKLRAAGRDPSGNPIKSVIFSSWTGMLDLLENALSQSGFKYQRIDGTKTLKQRTDALNMFREDGTTTVLLASLGSGAVGLNLTAASHVHIVEPGWNPMLERQALDRVHRLGQTRPVKAFRYIVAGDYSIEKHIIAVQKRKLELMASSFRVETTLDQETNNLKLQDSIADAADSNRVRISRECSNLHQIDAQESVFVYFMLVMNGTRYRY
ncbi:SNF2 family N-terminal domain-containing protein [Cercophora scortea]|uniref:SNF2 family N-terminal domain-containing protein n=1 Tax=Cercophora scortea TaxID=314031 RepID=A0AAE0IDT8_9PEZI|nr:SNF2 family N-terminal domain-containing protein [Cercophora scortea]